MGHWPRPEKSTGCRDGTYKFHELSLSLVWLFDMIKIIFYSISYYVLNIGYGTLFLFVCI